HYNCAFTAGSRRGGGPFYDLFGRKTTEHRLIAIGYRGILLVGVGGYPNADRPQASGLAIIDRAGGEPMKLAIPESYRDGFLLAQRPVETDFWLAIEAGAVTARLRVTRGGDVMVDGEYSAVPAALVADAALDADGALFELRLPDLTRYDAQHAIWKRTLRSNGSTQVLSEPRDREPARPLYITRSSRLVTAVGSLHSPEPP
ncbi:MAG: hypothetical protein OXR73_36565, partial [Myxococcales bacterium]|nr:hypothetical protein [Myxococcales bacterium]